MMPLAGGFTLPGDPKALIKYPLTLVRCNNCTLMQTIQDIPPEDMFSQYSYSSSASPGLVKHFNSLSDNIRNYIKDDNELYIDIGCNDGVLIRPMKSLGVKRVLGIDPSDVAIRSSVKYKWPLINKYLTPDLADRIVNGFGKARLITACNVLAHMIDPHPVIEGISRLLSDYGIVVAEVHYQASMITLGQFDTVYHEHTCYYSLKALSELFEMHGLKIYDAVMISNHGGSLRVYAAKEKINPIVKSYIRSMIYNESDIEWSTFETRAKKIKYDLRLELIKKLFRKNIIAAYGASGRGTILLNWCELGSNEIAFIMDNSHLRYGRIVPGVMIPIFSPKDVAWEIGSKATLKKPDTILLTAWNYADSIKDQHPEYHGEWLVPLPEVKYI